MYAGQQLKARGSSGGQREDLFGRRFLEAGGLELLRRPAPGPSPGPADEITLAGLPVLVLGLGNFGGSSSDLELTSRRTRNAAASTRAGASPAPTAETTSSGNCSGEPWRDPEAWSRESELPSPPRAWRLELHAASPELFRDAESARRGEAFWQYFLDLETAPEGVRLAGLDFAALLLRAPERRVIAHLPAGLGGGRLRQAMNNLLRVLTAFAVADAGGVLLHSAAILAGGRGYLFPGRSGAGKSTLSRLALELGHTVLSDELNVLWPGREGDEPRLEQVPFTGDLGRLRRVPGRFPAAAVLPLVRTGADERRPLSRAEAYAALFAEAVFVNSDPLSSRRLEETLVELLSRLDPQSFSFTLDGELAALEIGDTSTLPMARAS